MSTTVQIRGISSSSSGQCSAAGDAFNIFLYGKKLIGRNENLGCLCCCSHSTEISVFFVAMPGMHTSERLYDVCSTVPGMAVFAGFHGFGTFPEHFVIFRNIPNLSFLDFEFHPTTYICCLLSGIIFTFFSVAEKNQKNWLARTGNN